MARKRNRSTRKNATAQNQAVISNSRAYMKNMDMLISLALSRFRITGLPNTCNERYLLWCLLRYGVATICFEESLPDVWQTLRAVPQAEYNAYGYPVSWRALGENTTTQYNVTPENGALIYYSRSSAAPYRFGMGADHSPWNALDIFAQRLAKYERTEEVNLTHQFTPWFFTASPEKVLELTNLMANILSGQPAVMGSEAAYDMAQQITAINTQVPFIGEDLGRGWMNVFHQAMMYLGIPHLAFEKGERMIEDEARANTAPTNIMLLDCLNGMRDGFKELQKFGLDIEVFFNEDFESYNFNYLNNVEMQMQDGGVLNG